MSTSKDMTTKVKEVAVDEAERIKQLSTQAIRSQAYLYPVKVSSHLSNTRRTCNGRLLFTTWGLLLTYHCVRELHTLSHIGVYGSHSCQRSRQP